MFFFIKSDTSIIVPLFPDLAYSLWQIAKSKSKEKGARQRQQRL